MHMPNMLHTFYDIPSTLTHLAKYMAKVEFEPSVSRPGSNYSHKYTATNLGNSETLQALKTGSWLIQSVKEPLQRVKVN